MGGICNGEENNTDDTPTITANQKKQTLPDPEIVVPTVCFNSRTNVYCKHLLGQECLIQLKGNYLWIFGDGDINKTRDMKHLQCVIDLTSIKSYSFDEESNETRWKWVLQLNSKLQQTNTKELAFKEADSSLRQHILDVLHKYNVEQLQQNESKETEDEEKAATRQTQEQEQEQEQDARNGNGPGNILFASYLMHEDVPYYAVLRNMQLQLFADYSCFVNHNNNKNNGNDNVNNPAMKTFDILSEFEKCVPEHEKNGRYYNMNKYAFRLIYKTKDDLSSVNDNQNSNNTRITFVSFSNNARFEFCLHFDFLLIFKCMPNTFLSPALSRFDNIEIKNKLNETHAPLMQQISKMYSESQANENNTKSNDNNTTDKLRIFDGIFRVWHKTKTIEEYLKQSKNIEHAAVVTTDDINTFPEFQTVLQSINVPPSTIMSLYSIALQNNQERIDSKTRCKAGTKCCSYVHYRRDRRKDRQIQIQIENHSDNSNIALSFIRQTQENCIVNDLCKIHAFLYAHNDEEEEEQKEEEKEEEKEENANENAMLSINANANTHTLVDDEIKAEDESDSEIYVDHGRNTTTSSASSNLNDDKFIITAAQTKDGKFGYGLVCYYYRFYRDIATNFIFPVHSSLLDEVCFNKKIASKFCISLTQFWTFYLKALYLRNVFKEFVANDCGSLNHKYNIEVGCLLSVHHFISLMLYSDLTVFQCEFKKYTRKSNENESEKEFYVRNSYVAHWCRYLSESVEIFGTRMGNKKKDTVYCGISVPLLFDSFEQSINAPLSTSASRSVGIRFAGYTGMMLKLQRKSRESRFFPIYKFSEYSEEEERFIYGTTLKITNIGWQCKSSPHMFSCFKFIKAMRLLEKVLKGLMFVDCNPKLIQHTNTELMMQLIECYVNGNIYHDRNESNKNNNNGSSDFPDEYYEYNQKLFNNRIHQFMKVECVDNENQMWLNKSELDRVSSHSPLLYDRLSDTIRTHSINSFCETPTPMTFVISKGVEYARLQSLQIDELMPIGPPFTVEKNGIQFEFEAQIMRGSSSSPNVCILALILRNKPFYCTSMVMFYDVICPELKYEYVNDWKQFRYVNDYESPRIFANALLSTVDSLTISVCVRIVEMA